jgi:hypothetical protein
VAITYLQVSGQTFQFNADAGMVPAALMAASATTDRVADLENFGLQGGNHDDTGAFSDALTKLGAGGTIRIPTGDFQIGPLAIPASTQSLCIEGVQGSYAPSGIGSRIVAGGSGASLLSVIASTTKLTLRNVALDGMARTDDVVLFLQQGGQIIDFILLDGVDFHNVKAGGSFIKSWADDFVGGENALVVMRGCTFNLNGSVSPSSKGSALKLRNYGAWGWLAEKCNFFGGSGDEGSVVLESGELTIRDAEFENNSVHDIVIYGASRFHGDNIHSQSPAPVLDILPPLDGSDTSLLWFRDGVTVDNLQHRTTATPPACSVRDTGNLPLRLRNVNGYGVQMEFSGNKVFEVDGNHGGLVTLNGVDTVASMVRSQIMGDDGQDIQRLYSRDGGAFWGVGYTPATGEVGVQSYRSGIGYQNMSYSASLHRFLFGPVELGKITSLGTPPAGALRFGCLDNGSGKMQLVVQFPTGAIQVLGTEP